MLAKTKIKFHGELGTNVDCIDEDRLLGMLYELESTFNAGHLVGCPVQENARIHIFVDKKSKRKKKNENKK